MCYSVYNFNLTYNYIFLAALLLTFSTAEKGLEFPVHDGKDRIINLSKKNFNRQGIAIN